jgi:hypothetical protein
MRKPAAVILNQRRRHYIPNLPKAYRTAGLQKDALRPQNLTTRTVHVFVISYIGEIGSYIGGIGGTEADHSRVADT